MNKTLLISLSVFLFLPNFFNIDLFSESSYNHKEYYDPSLSYINTLHKLNQHIDSTLGKKRIACGTYEYVTGISNIVSNRFYHGYSHFTLRENWIAAVSGILIEPGMASKVHAGNIIKNPGAACSQQVIVMMAALRAKGIPYRHLGFPHHYALEVLINGKWYFFDPDMEPQMNKAQQSEDNWRHQSDSLKQYYCKGGTMRSDYTFGAGLTPHVGSVNEVPAANARLFQTTTGILSKTLGCLPLLLLFLQGRKYFPCQKKASR